jgi:hypothetical protein
MKRFAVVPLLVAALAGCGSVAPPDYKGEPLAEFHGYVAWQRSDPMPTVDLVLFWPDWSQAGPDGAMLGTTAVRMPLDADAPTHFDFKLFTPPLDTAYYPPQKERDGVGITMSSTGLLVRGADPVSDPLSVVATLNDYQIGYVDRDADITVSAPDGTSVVQHLRKGFTLKRFDVLACAESIDQACVEGLEAAGETPDFARYHCQIKPDLRAMTVDLPLDTEIPFIVYNPAGPPVAPPVTVPCPPP